MSLGTLGKIGMADKLSVSQLQQAVQNGSIPAYIGIPLIQEKVKAEQEMQAAQAAQNTPQNSVAEQVMAEATQQEMSGLGDLQTNLPEQYASGGIIGYDEGGDITQEEYDDQIADAEFDQFARAMINRTPNVEKGLRSAPSMSYSQVQGQAPRNAAAPGDGINSLIEKYAAKHGVPVDLARNIAMAESGGSFNSKDPRSSARGPFGMIESTWKSLGGTSENRNDPEANVDLGIKLIKQNAESMKGSLGKNPSYGDVYAAHHFGTGVSKMLAKADPNESIESGLSRFESPGRIKTIMSSNPHLRGKTVGEVESMLNKKGGEGVYAMAEGGIASIKRYAGADGSLVEDTEDPDYVMYNGIRTKRSLLDQSAESPWNSDRGMTYPSVTDGLGSDLKTGAIKTLAAAGDVVRSPFYAIDRAFGSPFMDKSATPFYDKYVRQAGLDTEPETSAPATTSTQTIGPGNAGTARRDQIAAENKIAAATPSAYKPQTGSYDKTTGTFTGSKESTEGPKPTEKPAEKSSWQSLRDLIEERKAERKAQKDQDMWLAIMAGGLGTMAGTSQYAGVNLGQGAMHGLQQYGAARREAGKEEAADLKNLANIARYEEMGKYYNDQIENKLATAKGSQDQKEYIAANNLQKNLWEAKMDEAKYMYGDPKTWDDATRTKVMAYVNQVKLDPQWIDADRRKNMLGEYTVLRQNQPKS